MPWLSASLPISIFLQLGMTWQSGTSNVRSSPCLSNAVKRAVPMWVTCLSSPTVSHSIFVVTRLALMRNLVLGTTQMFAIESGDAIAIGAYVSLMTALYAS